MNLKEPKTLAEWLAYQLTFDTRDADGWVYFIREKRRHGHVKIGYTRHFDVEKRRSTLQVGNPYKLEVVTVIRGSRDTERSLHRNFMRWRLQGEWFLGKADGLLELMDILSQIPQQSVLDVAA